MAADSSRDRTIAESLLQQGIITQEQLEAAEAEQEVNSLSLVQALLKTGACTAQDLARAAADAPGGEGPGSVFAQSQSVADMAPDNYEEGHDDWAEACLRVGLIQQAVNELARRINQGEITLRRMMLLGLGWALANDAEKARAALNGATMILDHSRPRRSKLSRKDWRLFDELVEDKETLKALEDYFVPPIFIAGKDFEI